VPAAQALQLGNPELPPNMPATHFGQVDAPATLWYDPAAQMKHNVALPAEYEPTEQGSHAFAPANVEKVPALQFVHATEPTALW